jgi:hypothetical protein
MTFDKNLSAAQIFALLGITSVLSLFVVLPYTIGYFLYFEPTVMSLFSLNDFYQFSAFPILMVAISIVTVFGFDVIYHHIRPSFERWSHFLRQGVKVDLMTKRTIHHEDAETVFG